MTQETSISTINPSEIGVMFTSLATWHHLATLGLSICQYLAPVFGRDMGRRFGETKILVQSSVSVGGAEDISGVEHF